MHLTTSFLQPCVQAFTSISGFLLLLLLFHRLIRNLLFLLSTFYSPLPSPSLNHRPLPLVYLFHPICSPHLPSVFGHQFLPSSRAAPDFICSPGIPFQLLARLLARLLACLLTHTIKCTPRRCSNFFYEMKFDAVLVQFFPTKISHFRSPFHGSEGRIRTHTHTHTINEARYFFFLFFFENRGHATHKSRETVGFYDETYPFSPPSRGNEGKTNRYAPLHPVSRNSIERRSFADCNCESV